MISKQKLKNFLMDMQQVPQKTLNSADKTNFASPAILVASTTLENIDDILKAIESGSLDA